MYDYHEPVLLHEAIEGLSIRPDGIYLDVTFGGGGHSKAILNHLGPNGKLFAFDQDADAQQNVPPNEPRLTFIPHNFRYIKRYLRLAGAGAVDGILADLGVSWHQLDVPERGFSHRFDEQILDMRMDTTQKLNAAGILATYSEAKLVHIFQEYGELPGTKRLAAAIVETRKLRPIKTVGELKKLAAPFMAGDRHKYLSQLFQALRIAVNDEIVALQEFLTQSAELLRPEGRLVIIAYHSLEDRLVKNYIKTGSFEGIAQKDFYGHSLQPFKALQSKPIVATAKEIAQNSKARSAKLRIGVRI